MYDKAGAVSYQDGHIETRYIVKGAFVCPDNGRYVAIMAVNSIMAVIDNGRAFGWDNGQ